MLKDKDSRESIQVAIRIRPISSKQKDEDLNGSVKVEHEHTLSVALENDVKKFNFDTIIYNTQQQELFQRVGRKSAEECLQGYNCTIFAYGQAGSGKTYTMMGPSLESRDYNQNRGLIPRTLEYLFQRLKQQAEKGENILVRCSFIQIYNEQIIDLLNKSNTNLQLRQNTRKGVYVQGITEQTISRCEQAIQLFHRGSKLKHLASYFGNQTSSRSHSVFLLQLESKCIKNGLVNYRSRQFNFVDLAGSERTKQSTGQRLKEGCSINKSLMALTSVINSLSEIQQGKIQHVNYRNSKLTFLLKDALGGKNSKTTLIANISPASIFCKQTISTLQFAQRVKLIKRRNSPISQDSSGNLHSMKACFEKRQEQFQQRLDQANQELSHLKERNDQTQRTLEQQIHKIVALNQSIQLEKAASRIINQQFQHLKEYVKRLEKNMQVAHQKQQDKALEFKLKLLNKQVQISNLIKQIQALKAQKEDIKINQFKLRKQLQQLQGKQQLNFEIQRQSKKYQNFRNDKHSIKVQIENLKINTDKIAQKNQQMSMKIKKASYSSLKLQKQYEDVKRSDSASYNNYDDKNAYINRLKTELAIIKKQKKSLAEALSKEKLQKMKLQTEKQENKQLKAKLELEKKKFQNKHLAQIIQQILNKLNLHIREPLAKLQGTKSMIINEIQKKNNQIKQLRQLIKSNEIKNRQKNNNYSIYGQNLQHFSLQNQEIVEKLYHKDLKQRYFDDNKRINLKNNGQRIKKSVNKYTN